MPGIRRRRVIGEKMMISQVFLARGTQVPTHSHANEQFACMIAGRLRFDLGAEGDPERRTVTAVAGEVMQLPPNLPHAAYAEEDSIVLDMFSPPSATTGIDRH